MNFKTMAQSTFFNGCLPQSSWTLSEIESNNLARLNMLTGDYKAWKNFKRSPTSISQRRVWGFLTQTYKGNDIIQVFFPSNINFGHTSYEFDHPVPTTQLLTRHEPVTVSETMMAWKSCVVGIPLVLLQVGFMFIKVKIKLYLLSCSKKKSKVY